MEIKLYCNSIISSIVFIFLVDEIIKIQSFTTCFTNTTSAIFIHYLIIYFTAAERMNGFRLYLANDTVYKKTELCFVDTGNQAFQTLIHSVDCDLSPTKNVYFFNRNTLIEICYIEINGKVLTKHIFLNSHRANCICHIQKDTQFTFALTRIVNPWINTNCKNTNGAVKLVPFYDYVPSYWFNAKHIEML